MGSLFLMDVFRSSMSLELARKSGGYVAFLIAVIMLFSGIKFVFLEFAQKDAVRSLGYKVFVFFHELIGWFIVILAGYHSLYYLYYYYNVHVMDLPMMTTGLGSLICVIIIMLLGKDLTSKNHVFKSSYKIHVVVLIVAIILILYHLNVR
ncbi:Na+-driven multidrug efflux pump [Desulfosporosinus sp. I2]|uniref:ferric reductase-like transmembrane domain-containing protein n=1 Tax=Desulfosporosinus sp. I2 TaxID=1617025 RepID=UPI0005F006F9|nr:ferric reductase-like transmembrane domain-containing protein [Desulfosporosinus sp. I2]KJR49267.1 Na+-driven multidrug efflux pump [Desulfosporosinus sp. I2]